MANQVSRTATAAVAEAVEGWAQVRQAGTWMTKDDLHAFVRAYEELLDRYGHPDDDVPDGARRVNLRFYAAPDPVGEWEGEPTGP